MAADCEQPLPAFRAFECQLNELCIKEFPCGLGGWREPDTRWKKPKKIRLNAINGKLRKPKLDLNISKDPDALQETSDSLQGMVSSKYSPWHLDYTWSDEAEELRQIAVKSPWLIDDQFILNHFRTLKIVDKGVTEVDERLLSLQNLSELTLTANFIRNVNTKYVPQTLQVLELCANEISDISGLCVRPPLLLHLGLGYNTICFLDDYLTGDYWPSLLSLDLSNNNLTDLLDIVRKMSSLPKLRNLILVGNPLSLIPGYRGYTIDSLRKLSVLDDIHISADERHHFKGLARRRECIIDEAKVELRAYYLRNVPVPEEMKFPGEQPEYPIIERNYYVQFMFVADLPTRHMHSMTHSDFDEMGTIGEQHELASDIHSARLEGSQHSEKNVAFCDQKLADNLPLPLIEESDEPPKTSSMPGSQGLSQGQLDFKTQMEASGTETAKPVIVTAPITSVAKPWAEEVELDWRADVVRFDLLALRDFFRQGMDFSIVEEMVQCFPAEEEENMDTPNSKSKDGSKDKKDSKGKGKDKGDKGEKEGKKKKKGEEIELRREPPQVTTLATFHVPLREFLEGEYDFTGIFTQGGIEIALSTARSVTSADHKKKGSAGKGKDKKDAGKDKKGKDGKDARQPSPKGKGGKDDKNKGKKGGPPFVPIDPNETPPPPPPLEVKVAVRLHHWATAMDSLKEDEKDE